MEHLIVVLQIFLNKFTSFSLYFIIIVIKYKMRVSVMTHDHFCYLNKVKSVLFNFHNFYYFIFYYYNNEI